MEILFDKLIVQGYQKKIKTRAKILDEPEVGLSALASQIPLVSRPKNTPSNAKNNNGLLVAWEAKRHVYSTWNDSQHERKKCGVVFITSDIPSYWNGKHNSRARQIYIPMKVVKLLKKKNNTSINQVENPLTMPNKNAGVYKWRYGHVAET